MPHPIWLTPLALLALALPSFRTPVLAQAPVPQPAGAPVRLNATVAALSGDTLSIKMDDGTIVPIALPPGTRVGSLVERSLDDIKPGEFIGSAAMRGRDGKLHAQEVHIFPESQRGSGEGHRPMDMPEQTMTNANIGGVDETPDGRSLKLRYAGGEQTIEVGPGVRVVGLVPGDRSLLVPGAAVTIRAVKAPDGTMTAVSIQAEKDGVKPLP